MTEDDDLYHHSKLETAVLQNEIERFHSLVNQERLHQRSDNGSTLLHKADRQKHLKSVKILDNVIKIGEEAFRNNNLESVKIPDSVEEIADDAFDDDVEFSTNTAGRGS